MLKKLFKIRKERKEFIAKKFGWFSIVLMTNCILLGYSISFLIFFRICNLKSILVSIPALIFGFLFGELFFYRLFYQIIGGKNV